MEQIRNSKLAFLVVGGQIVLAVILTFGVVGCLFYRNYSDPATLTAVILLDGTIVGNLASILGGPRMMTGPTETKIVNPPSDPVPVEPKIQSTVNPNHLV